MRLPRSLKGINVIKELPFSVQNALYDWIRDLDVSLSLTKWNEKTRFQSLSIRTEIDTGPNMVPKSPLLLAPNLIILDKMIKYSSKALPWRSHEISLWTFDLS